MGLNFKKLARSTIIFMNGSFCASVSKRSFFAFGPENDFLSDFNEHDHLTMNEQC